MTGLSEDLYGVGHYLAMLPVGKFKQAALFSFIAYDTHRQKH